MLRTLVRMVLRLSGSLSGCGQRDSPDGGTWAHRHGQPVPATQAGIGPFRNTVITRERRRRAVRMAWPSSLDNRFLAKVHNPVHPAKRLSTEPNWAFRPAPRGPTLV
jgi:hypothetical protein